MHSRTVKSNNKSFEKIRSYFTWQFCFFLFYESGTSLAQLLLLSAMIRGISGITVDSLKTVQDSLNFVTLLSKMFQKCLGNEQMNDVLKRNSLQCKEFHNDGALSSSAKALIYLYLSIMRNNQLILKRTPALCRIGLRKKNCHKILGRMVIKWILKLDSVPKREKKIWEW